MKDPRGKLALPMEGPVRHPMMDPPVGGGENPKHNPCPNTKNGKCGPEEESSIIPTGHENLLLKKQAWTVHVSHLVSPCEAHCDKFDIFATASLHSATPKRKNVPRSFDFGGGEISFEKGKGVFLSEFCPPCIRAV